jgi:flagellar biosynthetic protein FliR
MLEALLVGYALRFALITCRVSGFVVASPFPGDSIPQTARVGLVVVLSAVGALAVGAPDTPPVLGLSLAVHSVFELGLGVLIGFAFFVLFAAADILGGILSHAIGFAMPSLLNPAFGNTDTAVGNLVSSFSMLLVLSMGLHRTAIGYLLESFRAVPPGHLVALPAAMPLFIELVGASIVAAARLAMPVVAVSITSQAALAMLSRASPSLQIFSIGFTLLILAGLSTLSASLQQIAVGLMQHMGTLPTTLDRLLEFFAGA